MKEKKMRIYLLLLAIVPFVGCSPDLDEAQRFPYNASDWESLNYSASTGRGDNEFEKNRDREAANKEISALKDKIFTTYRTAYRIEDWKKKSKDLKPWYKFGAEMIRFWEPNLILQGEPKSGTYLPWIITEYDYDTESFRLIPPTFFCLTPLNDLFSNVSYRECFGDPPPTTLVADETSYNPLGVQKSVWSWYNEKVLKIEMNEEVAEKFVNSFTGHSFRIKIYYKYYDSYDNAVIVKVEGLTTVKKSAKNVLFETEYHASKNDTKGKASNEEWYLSQFTRGIIY